LSPFLGRGTDVDVTLDLMIHDIDIVMSIVHSRPADIRAVGKSVMSDKIDVAKAWIEFDNGCQALITASRLASEKVRVMKIFQKDCFLALDFQSQQVRRYSRNGAGISCEVLKPDNKEPLKEELKDFLSCVADRLPPKVSGEEAAVALEVAQRITSILKKKGKGHRV
jgi:predicted dehydrogenase